jgi:hypothetical protein
VLVHHHQQQMVAHAMSPGPGGGQQPIDFLLIEEVLVPFMCVGGDDASASCEAVPFRY